MASEYVDISDAEQILGHGGVIVYPTLTLWGVGGDARHPGVIDRVQSIKGRDGANPFLLLVNDLFAVRELTRVIPQSALRLMGALWPGELTLLLPASDAVPPALVGEEGFVGLRLPTHIVPYELIQATGAWLISTSANPTGAPAPVAFDEIDKGVIEAVDGVIDGPPAPTGTQSTIVAIAEDGNVTLIREGTITQSQLRTALGDEESL